MESKECIDCGKLLVDRDRRSGLCVDCAGRRVMDCAKQLREKKGPYYEKWKAGMKAAAERL